MKNYELLTVFKPSLDSEELDKVVEKISEEVKSYEGSKVYSTIDNKSVEKINNICKEYSITPYMLLLSIYYILLSNFLCKGRCKNEI